MRVIARQLVWLSCLLLFWPGLVRAQEPQVSADSAQLEVIKSKKADYPLAAIHEGIQGQVLLQVLISEKGDVENIAVASGNPVLAKAAVDACKKWKFKPFIKGGKPVKVSTKLPFDFYFSEKKIEGKTSADGSTIVETPPSPSESSKRVQVDQGVVEGMLIHKIAPVYPQSALQMHVQGKVILQAVIGKDGRIQNLHSISGPKELIPAAVGAVQQWRYKPYLLMGEPVEVETQITVNFQLRH